MGVMAAYVAGLISTPAAFLGAWQGARWWARVRRAEAPTDVELTEWVPPAPPSPQEVPRVSRISFRNAPGRRRNVRGHR